MAVIIIETRIIGGKEHAGTKVYKSDQFVTQKMMDEANKLDQYLQSTLEEIQRELKKFNTVKPKSKMILKIRHELGKRLVFVDDQRLVHPDDRKYIWRALYDHAADLAPGGPDDRANYRPETSFFYYCYKLGQLPWEVIESGGDWSAWQRFFDLAIKRDERILSWLARARQDLQAKFPKNWLKETTKLLTEQFHNRDTTVLTGEELEEELNGILNKYKH